MPRPVTLVTGASSGLGAEFARAFAARGEELVLTARRKERLEEIAAGLEVPVRVIPADLAERGAPAGLVAAIEAEGLHVATLVNNAGFGLAGEFARLPLDRQLAMIDLNIGALVQLAHLVLPPMRARGRGAILNVASTAAFQPGPDMAVYFATKAFVLSFSEALHEETKAGGIRVTALCPGPTATEFGEVAGFASGRFRKLATDAASVVAAGLAGFDRGKAVVVPGTANRIGAGALRFLPRGLVRRIVARLEF
ncbi:MAG: SDR family NAD(P)-dependent oxidoreductase [Sphingomonadaceae bacterium]